MNQAGQRGVTSIVLTPDGKTLVSSAGRWPAGEWPAQWDLGTGKLLRRFTSKEVGSPGGSLALSADGKTLAVSTAAVGIRFWDAGSAEELPVAFHGEGEPLS